MYIDGQKAVNRTPLISRYTCGNLNVVPKISQFRCLITWPKSRRKQLKSIGKSTLQYTKLLGTLILSWKYCQKCQISCVKQTEICCHYHVDNNSDTVTSPSTWWRQCVCKRSMNATSCDVVTIGNNLVTEAGDGDWRQTWLNICSLSAQFTVHIDISPFCSPTRDPRQSPHSHSKTCENVVKNCWNVSCLFTRVDRSFQC